MAEPPASDPFRARVRDPIPNPGGQSLVSRSDPSMIRRLVEQVRLPRPRRHRSTANRIVLAVLATLGTMLLLLTVDAIWASRAMFRGVSGARSALSEGTIAVVTGDPSASIPHFEDAAESADAALAATGHPSIALARLLPWIGDNVAAVEAVAEASHRTADAGMAMSEAARILGWNDLRLPATEAIGDVDLAALRAAAPALDEVAVELGGALEQLEAADTGRLIGPVAAGFEDAAETLRRRAEIAFHARDLVELLPRFLGGGAERRYLLAVQTLGRPQGTGGEVDLIGVLAARDGVMTLDTPLAPASDVFAETTAAGDARSAGENLLAAARDAGLGELDGAVLTDSVWLADALWTTGSVEVPDRDLPVNADRATAVLEREVFEGPDAAAAATRRAEVANAVVESYLAGRPATEAFAVALGRDVAERHLVVVAARARERRIIERLGAGGAPGATGQLVAVRWDTAVDNHSAVFARREVSHRVVLEEDGSARVRTVVTLVNEAPEQPPSALLGFPLPATVDEPAGVNPVGGWAADVGVLLPSKADRITAETSIPSETDVVKEDGRTTVIGRLAADPGDSMTLIVGYRVADARTDDGVYRLLIEPQPAWPAGVLRLEIAAPPGSTIVEASEDLEIGGNSARYAGTPARPFRVWIRFA